MKVIKNMAKTKLKEKKEDMRLKKCKFCKKDKWIHKYDAYCSSSCRKQAYKNVSKIFYQKELKNV